MKLLAVILFTICSFSFYGQQTAEKIAADKLSAIDYVNNQVLWLKNYTDSRIEGMEKAVDKFEATNNYKFQTVNEFRGQLDDQTRTFVTRRELWLAFTGVCGLIIAAAGVVVRYKTKDHLK